MVQVILESVAIDEVSPGFPGYIDVCDLQSVKDILLWTENVLTPCIPPVFCYKSQLFLRHEVNVGKESQIKINSHIAEHSGCCSRGIAGWKLMKHGVLTSISQESSGQFASLALIGWKQTIALRAQKYMHIWRWLLFIHIWIYKLEIIWSYKHLHFKVLG